MVPMLMMTAMGSTGRPYTLPSQSLGMPEGWPKFWLKRRTSDTNFFQNLRWKGTIFSLFYVH